MYSVHDPLYSLEMHR